MMKFGELSGPVVVLLVLVFGLEAGHPKGYGQSKGRGQKASQADTGKVAATVKMTDQLTFTPDTVTIKNGQAVKWINASVIAHSATDVPAKSTVKNSAVLPEDARPFNSTVLDPHATYTHTFYTTGTYKYFCIPHEAIMRGWVIVKGK